MINARRRAATLVSAGIILLGPTAGRAQQPEGVALKPETSAAAQEPKPAPTPTPTPAPTGDQQPKIPDEDLRDPQRTLTGSDLVDAEFPGSWPMFGKDTRMKLGGYVKADFLYDFDGTTDKNQFLMATIPVDGTPEAANSGYVSLFARETRFNIDVRRIEKDRPPLRLFVEGDFWSSGNQFRLRHAYVVFGNFIAGQTWTTLSILESLVYVIDFAAGDALFGGRTTQLRYQGRLNDHWKLAVGVESLDFMGIENPSGLTGGPSAALPLLAARADYTWKSGLLAFGGSVGQLRWDGGADGPDATALQWDSVVAGRQYLGKNDFFTWNVSWGHGSGENIMAFAGSQANAVLTEDGRLETFPAFAFVAGYTHKWNTELATNASFAYGWLDTPPSRDPLALKRGGIAHVNLVWHPTKEFATGIEYMWGARRATDDRRGQANRVQGMVRLDF